ncbi:hypothetical protein ACP4OV_024933 [Aristida adscensionis]
MASSSSSAPSQQGLELILAASHGRPIAAYDALTGEAVAEFSAANTPRHGLAVVVTGPGAAFVAASHVCPDTGAGSIRLVQWCTPPAPARSLPVPEPVAALVASPHGSHLLAGGASGRVHAVALPSGDVGFSFPAHGTGGVSCLALTEDGFLLVSGGEDGAVAVFPLFSVLDAHAAEKSASTSDLAIYRIAAHAAPVSCLACGHGGRSVGVVASASADGTCKVWSLADGGQLGSVVLPCAALSLALDPTGSDLYAGGSDGRVHLASLGSPGTDNVISSPDAGNDSNNNAAALVAVAMANGCKSLVSCAEDGEVKVWDLTTGGLLLVSTFRIGGGAVSGALVVKRIVGGGGETSRAGGEGFIGQDAAAWTRASEMLEMEQMLRESEQDRLRSVELLEMNVRNYKRCLSLLLREVQMAETARARRRNRNRNADQDAGRQ